MTASNPFYTGAAAPNTQTQGAGPFYTNPNGTPSQYNPANNYGDSGMSYADYTAKYGTPAQQASAGSAAGAAANAAGIAAANNPAVNPTLPNTTVGQTPGSTPPLQGPGYGETEFAAHGNDLMGGTNSQALFNEGDAGSNPFYDDAINKTNEAINNQEWARGEWNGGGALAAIGSADANLRGQQALGLTNLANQADSANEGAYTSTMNAANGAETETNNRVSGGVTANMNLSNDQANLVDNFYQMAENGQLTTGMASIEAQLAASGVDAATAQALTNDILQAGGIAAKVSGGSGGK
jgi:hypothetical protein